MLIPLKALASLTILLLSASSAFAQSTALLPSADQGACDGTTIGGMACYFQEDVLSSAANALFIVVVTAGLWLVFSGVKGLASASENSSQTGWSNPFSKIGAGTALMAFPAFVMISAGSLGMTSVWNFSSSDRVGQLSPDPNSGTLDPLTMMGNFAANAAGPLTTLALSICALIGMWYIFQAILSFARMNTPQGGQESFGKITVKAVCGVLLVNTFWTINVSGSSFGLASRSGDFYTTITTSALSYASQGSTATDLTDVTNPAIQMVFLGLIPFGIFAFARGLMILADDGQGQRSGSMGAVTHMLGGIALINAADVTCAVTSTFYPGGGMCM